MRRLAFSLVGLVAGYAAGALCGYGLAQALSANVHDRAVEAAMAAAFVWGPLGALVGVVAGLLLGRRR